MSEPKKMRWTIASARQNLPSLVSLAAHEPQAIYRRDKLVARLVAAQDAAESTLGPSLATMLAEIQQICAEEDYSLDAGKRRPRPNPLVEKSKPPRKTKRK
jgi:antitoxin (DNA-binding transcriptional repressor) of toxin-antitoxin stability system